MDVKQQHIFWIYHYFPDVSNTASELDTKKVVDSVDNQGDEAPAPSLGPACPKCITTGTVNVLHDICNKQGKYCTEILFL